MDSSLLSLLRLEGAESIVYKINGIAQAQREEALQGIKIFALPAADTLMSKEDYYAMTKEQRIAWQRSKEVERRRLNKEAGINGNALLTRENVERWRSEGKTFAAIARDYIGCPDYMVSAVLKDQPTTKRILIRGH